MMIELFKSYVKEHKLCDNSQELMLAVSGGIDSAVMTDLFYHSGYKCTILHCNFHLRGSESDGDEAFTRSLASKYDYPIFVKNFETEDFADEKGISIQMAARDLRYAWFEEIANQHAINQIGTAHNMNDNSETFMLNLSRGTGIKGLTGIPLINGKYIRPLLFATRNDIVSYAKNKNLAYREDSSNASTKYHRNKIRHNAIPVFEEINASFIQTMSNNIHRLSESHDIYKKHIAQVKEDIFEEKKTHIEIDLIKLKQLSPISTWLYELFSPYGFSMDQCLNIKKFLDAETGKQFISASHRLYKDRNRLLLFKAEESSFERYYIDSPATRAVLPFAMDMEIIDTADFKGYSSIQNIACLDLEKLSFPLIVRKWQHGDYFVPLGMEQLKKVSDFYIDNKIPVPVKNRIWILASGKHIVWIMGHRIDNRYKITEKTKSILKLTLYEK